MTRRMFYVLSLLCVLAFATVGSATAPTVAAPATPSLTAPADPAFGGCRWYCGSRSYATQSQCQAACSHACEDIC